MAKKNKGELSFSEAYDRVSKKYKLPEKDKLLIILRSDVYTYVDDLHFVVSVAAKILSEVGLYIDHMNSILQGSSYSFAKLAEYYKKMGKLDEISKMASSSALKLEHFIKTLLRVQNLDEAVSLLNEAYSFWLEIKEEYLDLGDPIDTQENESEDYPKHLG